MKIRIVLKITLVVFLSYLFILNVYSEKYVPLFHVSLLTPSTSPSRIQWSQLIESTLPKIGIEVDTNEITGWGNFMPRYQSGYSTYAKGGFDLAFLGWASSFEWDDTKVYKTGGGENYQGYSNQQLDHLFDLYLTELNWTSRVDIFHQIQKILYEDLPTIGIISSALIYGMKNNLTGIDVDLISHCCSRTEYWADSEDNKITYAIPANFLEKNIFKATSFYDLIWMSSIYSGLFERTPFAHGWEPVLARNFSISSDYLSITIDLDPNAKFSNGEQILAEDVKYSYQLYRDAEINSDHLQRLSKWISNIDIIDNDTLIFNTNEIDIHAFEYLSLGIIDKSEVEPRISTYGYEIFDQPPGSENVSWSLLTSYGPYILNSYSQENIELIPNPFWNNQSHSSPLLNQLNFTFIPERDDVLNNLISGKVDIADGNYFFTLKDFNPIYSYIKPVLANDTSEQHMAVNMRHPILGTGELTPVGTAEAAFNVRKAISLIIDRQYIVNTILEGSGWPSIIPIPNNCYGFDYSLPIYGQDLDLARSYMELAGYSYQIYTPPNPTTPSTQTSISGVTTITNFPWILTIFSLIGVGSIFLSFRFKKK
ncbi:MAG: ABC transporter substrate-binding protein [Candidatus Heimdallarchaeaceae archaeon]